MTRRSEQMRRTTTAEVRPDAGRATRLSASAQSTGDFDHLPRTRHAICRCSRRPKGRARPHNDPESGECQLRVCPDEISQLIPRRLACARQIKDTHAMLPYRHRLDGDLMKFTVVTKPKPSVFAANF